MMTLNTKVLKAQFLTGLHSKKFSLKDLKKDKIIILLDCDDNSGDVFDTETLERFTKQQVEEWKKDSKNHLYIEL